MTDDEVMKNISEKIQQSVGLLSPELRKWVNLHLVQPRRIQLSIAEIGSERKEFWLVTDMIGDDDSSYRVVYDRELGRFGLSCILETGIDWYMGPYASFVEAVESM